jgi:hypothetical protein
MIGSLAAAPPFENSTAFASPAHDAFAPMSARPVDTPSTGSQQSENQQTAMLEPPTAPTTGPVPLPHPKPHISTALVTGPVPLPRPRPSDSTPVEDPSLPAFDRHAVD